MDFRWKNRGGDLPQVQPNFVDPQNTGAVAADASAPFQPSGPSVPQQDFLGGVSASATRTEKLAELQELRGRLAAIDAEIARVKAAPMSREKEMAVASKLAEIGELGLYQQLLSQRQNAEAAKRSAAQGIENELYNAEKLVGILESGSDEERANALASIEAAMSKAKEQGDKSGFSAESLPSYKRLSDAADKASKVAKTRASDREWANELWYKARKGDLVNADIAKMEEYIATNPNSDVASQLRPLVEQYKPKTRESKLAYEKRKKDALALKAALDDLPTEERRARVRNLTRYERRVLEEFSPETLKTLPME